MTTASRRALRIQTLRDPWRRRYALRRRVMLGAFALAAARARARGVQTERIGSGYGGWTVPADTVAGDWTCVCAGAGVDVSFDLGLKERYACRAITIDPTDESREHVARHDPDGRLEFIHKALWSHDGELEMFVARDPSHRTLSADDLQGTGRAERLPCVSLRGLGAERVDLIKLDIEGAEYEVVPTVPAATRVLCVEWHPTRPLREMVRVYRGLLASGFRLVHRDGADHTFMRP